jgi:hypothetical protein
MQNVFCHLMFCNSSDLGSRFLFIHKTENSTYLMCRYCAVINWWLVYTDYIERAKGGSIIDTNSRQGEEGGADTGGKFGPSFVYNMED